MGSYGAEGLIAFLLVGPAFDGIYGVSCGCERYVMAGRSCGTRSGGTKLIRRHSSEGSIRSGSLKLRQVGES